MQQKDPPMIVIPSNMQQWRQMCQQDPERAMKNMMSGVPVTPPTAETPPPCPICGKYPCVC